MRLYHFLLAGLLCLGFASCNLEGKNQSTPEIFMRAFVIEGHNDSIPLVLRNGMLMIQRGENIHTATFDTISVNEVVHFETFLFSQFSPLEEFRITSSRARSVEFTWSLPDSLQQRFVDMDASNLDEGKFVTKGVYNGFPFNFQYRILEPEDELTLRFTLLNGGSRDFNTTVIQFRTPAR